MRRALKDPINSFTSTLESFLSRQPLGKDQIGHLGEPILMHSSEITSSQINPALQCETYDLKKLILAWFRAERQVKVVLRRIPAIEPVEIHCLPPKALECTHLVGVYIRKSWLSPGSRQNDIKLCTQRFSGVLSHNPLHISKCSTVRLCSNKHFACFYDFAPLCQVLLCLAWFTFCGGRWVPAIITKDSD